MTTNSYQYEQSLLQATTPLLRYQPGMDTMQWKETTKAKLNELMGMDAFRPCPLNMTIEWEKDHEDFHEIRFTFQTEEGYVVPCHMLIPNALPKNATETPTPVICLQGHSTGMHISLGRAIYDCDPEDLKGDRDFAIRAVKEGFVPIVMEQRYMGECGGDEVGPSCLSPRCESLVSLLLGRCAIGERVWDISRLIDLLEENFSDKLNLEKLICMGNSGGGTATFYASCVEERIKTAIVSCAFCTYKDSIAAMPHCACNYIPKSALYFDMGDLAGLMAPRNLLIVAGKDDPIFPLHGVKESYELAKTFFKAAGCEDRLQFVIGDGDHRFYADQAWEAYRRF